uniref:RNA helicase n=1 Tax=Chenopodium quinoa TaxID=63459 RepID=A0A803MHF9_CHEQI
MTKSSKKRQKYGSLFAPEHTAGVDEIVRIKIHNILEQFRSSHDQVYTFEANMTNHECAVVHQESKKMGMISKSSGKGKQRRVAVFKSKPKLECSEQRENPVITFSDESKRVLNDLFIRYPPGEDEVGKEYSNGPTDNNNNPRSRGKRENIFCKPLMTKDEIEKQVELLTSKIQQKHHLQEISKKRSKLPIATFQDVITSTILTHQLPACKLIGSLTNVNFLEQVVLISGETGCGKTTQIRMDTKGGRNSSIVFCTNGIMLRVLVAGGSNGSQPGAVDLSQISHIIVDEIHERDRYSDFMLAILRDLLPTYPHLRMVLMSATLDAERFSHYFGGCPVIRVPGFTHPVKTFYLEEILSILRTPDKNHLLNSSLSSQVNEEGSLSEQSRLALDEAIEMSSSNEEFDTLLELISSDGTSKVLNYQHYLTGVSPLMVFAGKGRVGDLCTLLSLGADCHLQARDGSTALDWAKREDQSEAVEIIMKHMVDSSSSSVEEQQLLEKYMSTTNPDFIDVVLIEKLLRKICMESEDGAILVFLPGWEDINRTRETLLANPFFKDPHKFAIFSLHSMVPSAEQKKVFNRPPVGCRKIILSTNIAETAITIDDVVYVLDSGRMKEKSYDPYINVSTLQSSWTSKASAKQREGRAGRCQPGVCYHLYSKLRAVSFLDFQVPEIRRMPIEELCLQVKLLDPNCKVEDFLKKTLDPPVSETIKNAITVLQEIGALSNDEGLTELGRKLGSLPVHPLTSKMLFFAILLNCLDPALTLACAADYRDPFTLPMLPNEKKRAVAAKAELASLYGGNSDQLAIVAAFDCWRNARKMGQESRFCSEYFVSSSIMHMLSGMRNQLANELTRAGCIPDDISSCSMNAREPGIIRAVIVAGMYPMVGRLHPPVRRGKRLTVETANSGYDRVLLHPQSMNSKLYMKNTDELPLLVYDEKNEKPEDKVMSSPENAVTLIVDRWLPFVSTALEVAQIYCLRERLSAAILFKVTYPKKVLPPALGTSIYAVACILAYDGMTGVSILKESVDTLTSMVHNTGIGNSSAEQNKANPAAKSFLISLFSYSTKYHESSSQPVQVQAKKHSSKRRRGNKSGQGGP